MWGWRSDKTESINGYECKVFAASNVEFVTKTRTEHLTETDKARSKSNRTPLQNFLGIAEITENESTVTTPTVRDHLQGIFELYIFKRSLIFPDKINY